MNEQDWFVSLLGSTQGQFVLGVVILVFGSKAILSEKTIKEKFGGIGYLSRSLQARQQRAAERESRGIRKIMELSKFQHEYILHLTQYLYQVELKAAREGWDMPVPKVEDFYSFQDRLLGKEGEVVGGDGESPVGDRPDVGG